MFVVYEWHAWWQFKIVRALPEAVRLTAHPGEHADEVLARCPPGALAFAFHINATFSAEFPHGRDQLIAGLRDRGVVPINAAVTDISKQWVQAQCAASGLPVAAAAREGDLDERLIVKTNHNYGGRSERLLTPELLVSLRIPRPSGEVTSTREYPVVPRRDIPDDWWTDPGLAIERYIQNRRHRIYRVNVAGRRFDILRLVNTNVVKKVGDSVEKVTVFCGREQLERGAVPGVDAEVGVTCIRFLDRAGLDFGSLDVITDDDGRAYIVDVNPTPYGSTNPLRRLVNVRRGLLELINERSPHTARSARALGRGMWPTGTMMLAEVKRLTVSARRSAAE